MDVLMQTEQIKTVTARPAFGANWLGASLASFDYFLDEPRRRFLSKRRVQAGLWIYMHHTPLATRWI